VLIEAYGRCASQIPEALILGGRTNEKQRHKLSRRIKTLGLQDRVLLANFIPSIEALYRQATAHVFLSTYEGFGLTVFEAFASGCPVLAVQGTAISEVAQDAALLLDTCDVESASRAMLRLSSDQGLRQELKQRGLARARLFSWDRCAENTIAVYKKVLCY
jgi:glycosyltransferase involved in cell wall biosynthesis